MTKRPITTQEQFQAEIKKFVSSGSGEKLTKHLYEFENCEFSIDLVIILSNHCDRKDFMENTVELNFKNCDFNESLVVSDLINDRVIFEDCTFLKTVNFSDCTFTNKVKIYSCLFNDINFSNTTFKDLADFWNSTFNHKVIFYKTDFLGVTVFSAVTFVENVLFTYSLIDKAIFFRGTRFLKGLDLSLAVSTGNLGVFDIRLNGFNSVDLDFSADEDRYEKLVSKDGDIPLVNKRETFRIIKKRFEDLGDISLSNKYRILEKRSIKQYIRVKNGTIRSSFRVRGRILGWLRMLWLRISALKPSMIAIRIYDVVSKYFSGKFDRITLWLNQVSNNHASSYFRAILFTICVGLVFFYLSMISTSEYHITLNPSLWAWGDGIKYFVQFLNPTHDLDYLGKDQTWLFYLLDFGGRTFVGYGLYQFVQAFRKFR